MSKLKKFIDDNREAFDDKVPSIKTWENIQASFSPEKRKKSIIRPLYKWTMAAAAVLILSASVYFVLDNNKTPADTVSSGPAIPGTAGGGEEVDFTPQMVQFVKMIDMKQEELKKLAAEQPELYNQFTNDLNQLDSSYNVLKSQLHEAPSKELLLEALIQNLQLQISVLNQQLNIIHQIKEKKNSHEKNEQSI